MARLTTRESPKGFWPHPDEEYFHKLQTPPWKVPKERKFRGGLSRLKEFEPNKTVGGEVTTHNRFNLLKMDISTDANIQDTYVKNDDEETSDARNYAPSGHQPRKENPAIQENIFVDNSVLFNSNIIENVYHRDNDFISVKYNVNTFNNTENVYKRDNKHNNVMCKFNKNYYAGYYPNFITPILSPNKNFNHTNIQNNVKYHQNQTNNKFFNYFKHTDDMKCGTPQIIKAHNLMLSKHIT